MKSLSITVIILASIITVGIGFVNMEELSLLGVGFLFGAISPYLMAIFVLTKSNKKALVTAVSILSLIIAVGGVSLLVYSMYVEKDAQSALAFIVIPVYQWGLYLIALFPLYFIHKNSKSD
jgi:hypothetical protein